MTGDLNSEPTTEAVKILTESNVLWDSKTVTATPALGPEGTYYGYDLSKTPTSRIDYIFVTKAVDVLNYEVVNDDFTTGNIASDHLPVRVKIEL
jgi:endonuclease/exonuclease/phosphatase family metal-dependent hydrolase